MNTTAKPKHEAQTEIPSRYRIAYDGRVYMIQELRRTLFGLGRPMWGPYWEQYLDGFMELAYRELRCESKSDLEPALKRLQAEERRRSLYASSNGDFKPCAGK